MTVKFSLLLSAIAVVALSVAPASAQQTRLKYDKDGRVTYGANGPNRSYQQGPRTRVYVTTRSWLDAGTEVLPGDRKFTDYAFPPEIGYPTFAREKPQPADRSPAAQSAGGSRRLSDAFPASVLVTGRQNTKRVAMCGPLFIWLMQSPDRSGRRTARSVPSGNRPGARRSTRPANPTMRCA